MIMWRTGVSRSFAKEMSLEDEERSGWASEVDNNQLRASSKLILLQPQEKLLNNSTSSILQSFSIWSKVERWKSSVSASWADRTSKKSLFWSAVFSYSTQQWTISSSDCDMQQKMDFIQLVITSSMAGQRRSYKLLPKAKLALKNR